MEYDKNLFRVAGQVRDSLIRLRNYRYVAMLNRLDSLLGTIAELSSQSKSMGIAVIRGWFSAAEGCSDGINRLIREIPCLVTNIEYITKDEPKEAPMLSILVDELRQLEREFQDAKFDAAKSTISVVTESITLEDVYLGPFEIQLELSKLAELYKGPVYRVVALDPHPAATSEEVTHPHVSNQRLCEGEGSAAIDSALEDGRLCDFFTLVRSILNTYSIESPYVPLAEWEGQACYSCGRIIDSDESYYCSFCENSFCEECSACCPCCEETVCLGCAHKCEICDSPLCPNCVRKCPECGIHCCKACMENGICQNCQQEQENENEEHGNQNPARSAGTSATQHQASASQTNLGG